MALVHIFTISVLVHILLSPQQDQDPKNIDSFIKKLSVRTYFNGLDLQVHAQAHIFIVLVLVFVHMLTSPWQNQNHENRVLSNIMFFMVLVLKSESKTIFS